MTMESGAQHSTARAKFGASSIRVAGGTQNVSGVDSDDFTLGNSDFAIEAWVNYNTIIGNKAILAHFDGLAADDEGWKFSFNSDSDKMQFAYSLDGIATLVVDSGNFTTSLSVNTWYHLAITRSGTTIRFFVDGVQKGTNKFLTGTIHNCSDAVRIGTLSANGAVLTSNTIDAYLDEVRISVGTPRWTSNFTPETAPYTP
jgi:hypothetical protein